MWKLVLHSRILYFLNNWNVIFEILLIRYISIHMFWKEKLCLTRKPSGISSHSLELISPLFLFHEGGMKWKKNLGKHFHHRTKLAFAHPALVLGYLCTQNMFDQLNMTSWLKGKNVSFPLNCQSFSGFPTFCITEYDASSAVIQFLMSNLYTSKF